MANRRMINKSDVESLRFAALTVRQRYLFWAVMLYADDDGIIPVQIVRSRCFPFDTSITEEEVIEDLKMLEQQSFVALYDDEIYLSVLGWWDRQQIRKELYKETNHPKPKWNIPRPSKDDDNKKVRKKRTKSVQQREEVDKVSQSISGSEYTHSDGKKRSYPEHPLA